ncbi:hypothetical protein BDZ89DRAFT_1167735 [Hymenopellis radicata]|nr:hypothetical protein BDZ89DRAFT_1167735 [Hymenopellis radicata]
MRPNRQYASAPFNGNASGSNNPPGALFDRPNYFKRGRNGKKNLWYCDLCRTGTPSDYMSLKGAQDHERGAEHLRNVNITESSWAMPNGDWADWDVAMADEPQDLTKEEKKDNEHRVFVDQLHEFVPFWIRGVEAAQRGEVLKMEEFLESHEKYPAMEEAWGGWDAPVAYAWPGERGWPKERDVESINSAHVASDQPELVSMPGFERSRGSDVTMPSVVSEGMRPVDRGQCDEYDAHAFVEDIALQKAVDSERKKEMHSFFEMPTQDKVRRIDELIRTLHAANMLMSSITNNHSEQPLPNGWIKEFDQSGHPFYVDTHAVPPRSIWTHPYEDEQFLREHPGVREKVGSSTPHQYSAPDGPPPGHASASKYAPPKGKRGFFGRLKDKAIGTKEEREAEKQRTAMLQEQRRQQYAASRPMSGFAPAQPAPYGYQQGGMGMGGMMPMGGSRMGGMGGGRRRGGMGGMALPLAGGLVGGLLLGDALDGGFNDNDDFGGGGFDGGDFGGD